MAIFTVLGAGIASGVRMLLGQSRVVAGILVAAMLIPWLTHHIWIVRTANDWYAGGLGAQFSTPMEAIIVGPGLVLVLIALTLFMSGWYQLLAAAVPAVAFIVSWYLTFPIVIDAMPDPAFPFDNIPTIWLAIWTIAASVFLLVYRWPRSESHIRYVMRVQKNLLTNIHKLVS